MSKPVQMSTGQRIAALSMEALVFAVRLNSDDLPLVARRIYTYNTAPTTRTLAHRIADRAEAAAFLGVRPRAAWRRDIAGTFREERWGARRGPWRLWVNRSNNRPVLRHKIYVSPAPLETADVLAVVAGTCKALDVPAFKVGADLPGILRPDKLVVYVSDREAVAAVGAELQSKLKGVDAQGVPFTSQIGDTGVLSWAVDPLRGPTGAPGVVWSWRTDVAWRLAESITTSRSQADTPGRIQAALARLRADGIDPLAWRASEPR